MKSVLISIRPEWCEKIANGQKTIEVRKSKPKKDTPFKCYIYCTLPPRSEIFRHEGIVEYANELIRLQNGEIVYDYGMRLICDRRPYTKDNFLCKKVIGEFVCDEVKKGVLNISEYVDSVNIGSDETCLQIADIKEYLGMKYVERKGLHNFYGWHISDLVIYDKPKELSDFRKPCIMPRMPYCPSCAVGSEYNSETEAEFYRTDGECRTEWRCLNYLTRPPQSWCYVEGEKRLSSEGG